MEGRQVNLKYLLFSEKRIKTLLTAFSREYQGSARDQVSQTMLSAAALLLPPFLLTPLPYNLFPSNSISTQAPARTGRMLLDLVRMKRASLSIRVLHVTHQQARACPGARLLATSDCACSVPLAPREDKDPGSGRVSYEKTVCVCVVFGCNENTSAITRVGLC